jgi:2'-5' RNA ligase superfamily
MSESAIVVRIRVPAAIDRLRRTHDRSARLGVPAHVTILYPFVDGAELTPEIREKVNSIAGGFRAFEVVFASAARWPGVVYLEPQPTSRFSALIDICAAAFPEHPPYAGTIDEVIPHLTVAETDSGPLDEILAAARLSVPFEATADSLEVLAEGADGRWQRRWRLPFGP